MPMWRRGLSSERPAPPTRLARWWRAVGTGAVQRPIVTRGFTLVELAVTLMVLAVASALTAPAIGRGLDGLRARAEVSGFVGFLRAAREQAITRGETHQVQLDPETRTLAITAESAPGARSTRSFANFVRIDAEPPTALIVTFQPQGLSSGAVFHILARGNRRYLVTVDPLTGRVAGRQARS